MSSAPPFDVCGPLPTGVTVLEASAGTGKTYTIAALAARYVAEGTPLQQLLLVTFTRMATGELRDRVRERLVASKPGSSAFRRGADPGRDEVVRLLAHGPPDEVAQRRANLARALADFDAATIATTHGFCQEALGSLGVAGDVERDMTVVEDDRRPARGGRRRPLRPPLPLGRARPRITRAQAMQIARVAIENPTAALEPRDAPEDTDPGDALPARVRGARPSSKRASGARAILTYDDLLTRLDAALRGPDGRGRRAQAAGALPRRARRRVPGHGPGAVGRSCARAFGARRRDAGADRRPEAGDLRLPRRRRLRLPRRGAGGDHAGDAAGQLAQRRGPAATPTTRCSAAPSSATRASSTARCEAAPPNREPRLHGRAGQRAAARARPAARRRDDDPPGLRVQRAGAGAHRQGPGRRPRRGC